MLWEYKLSNISLLFSDFLHLQPLAANGDSRGVVDPGNGPAKGKTRRADNLRIQSETNTIQQT